MLALIHILLENKNTKDHICVIFGDKTQRLEKLKKRGQAPWQVGDGYPNDRGGNKNIRIEKNYRNCIEINEYINRFVSNAKQYLYKIQEDYEIDPDMFLRGQAVFHGDGVKYIDVYKRQMGCAARRRPPGPSNATATWCGGCVWYI